MKVTAASIGFTLKKDNDFMARKMVFRAAFFKSSGAGG